MHSLVSLQQAVLAGVREGAERISAWNPHPDGVGSAASPMNAGSHSIMGGNLGSLMTCLEPGISRGRCGTGLWILILLDHTKRGGGGGGSGSAQCLEVLKSLGLVL